MARVLIPRRPARAAAACSPAARVAGRALWYLLAVGASACIASRPGLGDDRRPPDVGAEHPAAGDARSLARSRTVVIATPADADALIPPLVVGTTGRQVTALLFEHLAEIGDDLNTTGDAGFRPRLARSWAWAADSLSVAFHLDPRARWHDGVPVRAEDVRFTFALYRDPRVASASADDLADVDSVSVRDPLTAVVWYRRRSPAQFHRVVSTLRILPAHRLRAVPPDSLRASAFARAPVGCGPFRFARWVPGAALELTANAAYYRGAPALDRVVWTVTPTPQAAVARLLAGEVDVYEGLQAEHLPAVARRAHLATLRYPGLQYGYLQFNLRASSGAHRQAAGPHPLFADRALRRALATALDRPAMVRNVFDTLADVSRGPFTRAQRVDTAVAQPPYTPDAARRALDSLGWRDVDGDGIREKGGRPLRFTLIVPNSSQARTRFAVLIQEQLRNVGANVQIEPLEFTAFLDRFGKRRFDAAIGAWALDPSPADIGQMWGRRAAADGLNYGSYVSAAFEEAVARALEAPTADAARPHYRRAHQIIVDDAPAVWLFEQRPVLAVHRRLRVRGVRPDAWWAGLADWSVVPDSAAQAARAPARTAAYGALRGSAHDGPRKAVGDDPASLTSYTAPGRPRPR